MSLRDIEAASDLLESLIRNLEEAETSGRWPLGPGNLLLRQRFDLEALRSARESAKRLRGDWSFLAMIVGAMVMMIPGMGKSVLSKVQAAGKETRKKLGKYVGWKKLGRFWSPDKLLQEIGECQRKTEGDLKPAIEEALCYISQLKKNRLSSHYLDFYRSFFSSVIRNLELIRDSQENCLKQQISNLCDELQHFKKYSGFQVVSRMPNEFHHHFTSAIAMISYRSCAFWFNTRTRTDPETARVLVTQIVNLHPEIDPSVPEVIELHLRFQKDYYRNNLKMLDSLGIFSRYLLKWGGEEDLEQELMSLVRAFLNSSATALDDVQNSLFAEVYALLAESAFLHRPVLGYTDELYRTEIFPRRWELFAKIRLLKAELYLKDHHRSVSRCLTDFSSDRSFKVVNFLTEFARDSYWKHKEEYMELSLVLSKEFTEEFKSVLALLPSMKILDYLVKLKQFLFKIVFFKAESFLTVLSKIPDPSIPHAKDQIDCLVQKLKCFKLIVMNKPVTPDEETTLVLAVVRRITLLSYSFLPTNDILRKIFISLPQLLDEVEVIMAKSQQISTSFRKSDFPKTYRVGFIDSLDRSIKRLLKYDSVSIAPMKPHLEVVQPHLASWKAFLSKLSDSDVKQEDWNNLGNRIMNVVYNLEYIFESIEIKAHLVHGKLLFDLLEEISLVNQDISSIRQLSDTCKFQNLPQVTVEMMTRNSAPPGIDEMDVDLVDQENVIMERLLGGFPRRDVVSIVGMPGSGKTTLAKKMYNNQNVIYYFHRRAWCTVSQAYSKRDLLLEILRDIHGLTDEIHRMSDDDLQSRVRRCLLKNKYLIVMDDVWEIAAWNDLQNMFPNDNNGSRILITSRFRDVALKINPASEPHPIRLLSDDESWMLLEKKIFKGNDCPQELLHVGKEIAHHCQGLPLAIVAIAGLLQQTEMMRDLWERISKSLSSYIIGDPENQCMKVLELSYKHLPEYLKPCFLYLGIFLKDRDIPVSKLIRFWTAEGFVQEPESKCLEDAAEDCLMDLINRSMVIVSKRRSNGKVKACQLHDLLRDLCHSIAKEENFFHLVTMNDEPYTSFPDIDCGMHFDDGSKSSPLTFENYRLSMYLKRSHFFNSSPSGPKTRSLIFFGSNDSEPRCPYDISFIFQNFRLLRVLDLECINMGVSFPVEIGLMVHLRYLAVSGYMHSIPSSISNLWKLETLVVRGLQGKVILPDTIWSMVRLRHLHVNEFVAFKLGGLDGWVVGSSFRLDNLVSFSTPLLSCGKDIEKILRWFPNLCKMKCKWYSSENRNGLPNFEFLTHLDTLKIIYCGRTLGLGRFVLPLNLKKLTLSNFRLPWDHVSSIGSLPNLGVLKLLDGAFEGERWEMKEEEFKELKFLELNALNIVEWDASSDHLPNLKWLVLRNCKDLEKIPYEFADISTLQTIEVQWCRQSVEESAEEIGDVTGEIEILITRS